MRFIWSIVFIAMGIAVMKYSFQLTNFFGHISWAEEHIGGGGTYTLYKIVGVVVIILALLYLFGSLGFVVGPLAPLFGK